MTAKSDPKFSLEHKRVVTKRILWGAFALVVVALAPRVLFLFQPDILILKAFDDDAVYLVYILVVGIVVGALFELLGPSNEAVVTISHTDIKPAVSTALRSLLIALVLFVDICVWCVFVLALDFSSQVLFAAAMFHLIWIASAIIVRWRMGIGGVASIGLAFLVTIGIFVAGASVYIALNPR